MTIRWLLCIALFSLSSAVSAQLKFEEHFLQTEFKITHPVITANLLGGEEPQIVIIGEDESKQRILTTYQLVKDADTQKLRYQEIAMLVIPDNFLAFDLLKTKDAEKILFQSNEAIYELDLVTRNFIKIIDSPSIYLKEKGQFLAQREFVKDANGDEIDDIIVPDFRNIQVFLQNEQGDFSKQVLPIDPKISLSNGSATYSETPVYFADLNLDQKHDLIVVKDASFQVFHQNGNGTFKTDSQLIQVPIDFKEMNWWEIRESDGEQMDQSSLAYRTVSQLKDINNDSVVDLMVRFSKTDGVLDRQNNYEIYLGKPNGSKVDFADKPDSVLEVDGTTVAVKTIDLDGDKKSEVLLTSLDIGVSQIIGALLSGSIDQDVYVFKMNQDDKYEEDPKVSKDVELSFSLSSGKRGQPVVKAADFNGDGLKDLLFSNGSKSMKIYMGTDKKRMFKRKSSKFKVTVPKDGEFVETKDLNNDGKEDLMVRYGRQDDEALKNKVVILMSR
ncbi:VCBS repeat-containing protein [Aliikangiella marina]|uniref:VCBS repeat-containing protein n=1 Tax=Aliikangiella marina TaxID=1712262 RepID=A0A545T4M6_9GAMM|nr:VCBS repeat-containing protein [Aliikangiella marina]TQV72177.1 VCBS repeat-containing protein [Aliikangiella marina]